MPRDALDRADFHTLPRCPADATGTTAYQYDLLGRVTDAAETRGALSFTQAYTYDLAGNILTITLDSGRVITYTRNANGQVSNVAAPVNATPVNLASSITYLPFGPLNALTYGNALTLSATFDDDYNPTNRTISGGIANWTYDTDANSNITQAGATTYGYDALNRVNAENPGTSASYTYDATSNRLTRVSGGTTTTTVPSTSNKISAVGAASYTYDAAGNITNDGTNTYGWSAAGLLATVNTTGGVYTYNAYNQRTKKLTGGVTTHYVYGAGGLLYGEYDNTGAMVREYVYLNGAPLAQITAGSPETVAYLHTDHLGTPRYATNSGGTQVWSWTNDAFGTSTPSGSVTVNLRMPGQYYDSESGLFYNWNRYYNPAIGRYISSDPIGLEGGQLNIFSYVAQNPVNNSDPEGLAAPRCFWNSFAPGCQLETPGNAFGGISPQGAGAITGGLLGLGLACLLHQAADYPEDGLNGIILNNEYPENPENSPGKFKPAGKKTPAKENVEDGSVWEPDYSEHGGSKWKRWRDKKSWEKGDKPEGVRGDGTVR